MKEDQKNIISEFFWSLAGFNKIAISESKVDRFHAKIIGVLLLLVGIYSTLTWAFFFQTVNNNLGIAIIGGLFMGFFIVSFDRALIASLSSGKTKLFSLIFRFILALLLGIFLSQPMILKFYQHEINKEAEIIYIEKVNEQKTKLKELYQTDIDNFIKQKAELQNELINKENLLINSEKDFKQEMDGTGGTKKRGYSIISKQKEKIFNGHKEQYNKLQSKNSNQIDSIQSQLDNIATKVFDETEIYKQTHSNFGTLIQVEALHSLLNNDKTGSLKLRYYLLSIILILIELSALIAKLLFKTDNYKNKIQLINELELVNVTNEKEIALALINTEKENIINSNKEQIDFFFENAKTINQQKTKKSLSKWNDDNKSTFNLFWKKFKNTFTI